MSAVSFRLSGREEDLADPLQLLNLPNHASLLNKGR